MSGKEGVKWKVDVRGDDSVRSRGGWCQGVCDVQGEDNIRWEEEGEEWCQGEDVSGRMVSGGGW